MIADPMIADQQDPTGLRALPREPTPSQRTATVSNLISSRQKILPVSPPATTNTLTNWHQTCHTLILNHRHTRVRHPLFNPRAHSLLRGSLLVLFSLAVALLLSDFPHNRATPLLIFPVLFAIAGTADTVRCMQRRWSFYHAGVILCIYMDLMALCMILFFLLYPYARWIASSQ
jgi:hypothetical protein